jgi:hypothetical protein
MEGGGGGSGRVVAGMGRAGCVGVGGIWIGRVRIERGWIGSVRIAVAVWVLDRLWRGDVSLVGSCS